MSWFAEDKRTWSQKLFGDILKNGPLPKHVAIIMDGNRRYAKSRNIQKIEGHISGFEKLVEVSFKNTFTPRKSRKWELNLDDISFCLCILGFFRYIQIPYPENL